MDQVLVAYFSVSGNTKRVAEKLALAVNSALFEIKPEIPYTKEDLNWMDKNSRSTIEMKNQHIRPAIEKTEAPVAGKTTIFLGFPIWWHQAPTIINTFLEKYDLSDKRIVPFATSGGGDMGVSVEKLKPSCAETTKWGHGVILNGDDVEGKISEWLKNLCK